MSAADRVRWVLVTGGGSGLAPIAPGTVGTLPGVLIAILLGAVLAGATLAVSLWAVAAALFAFGCAQTAFTERVFRSPDPGAFVLDEVVGYLVAAAAFTSLFGELSPVGHGLCFLVFRLFDVLKPPPVGRLEEVRGAPGIMLDDVGAGLYAAVVLIVARRLDWF